METTTEPTGPRPRWRRRLAPLTVAAAALSLLACEPAPPPDGSDLAIEAVDAPTDLAPGEEITVDAIVTNHGVADADAVRVGYVAPSHLTVTAIAGPQVSACTFAADLGTCDLGDLAPGETTTVEVTVTATTAAPTADLVLVVSSDASEPTPDPHPNSTPVPLTVGTGATVDLQVQGELPSRTAPGATFTSRSWVTNRSTSAASQVVVTQEVPAGATISATRFQRALPGGGTTTGSCTVADRTVSCTTDGQLVGPTTVVAQRWVLEVDMSAGSGTHQVLHTVSSPHPEPDPDPGPNTATRTTTAGDGIFFEPLAPVAVGDEFDVTGTAVTSFPIPAYYVSISRPSTVEAVSVTIDGQTTPCTPTGGCTGFLAWGASNGSSVTMRLRAVSPGPPAGVSLHLSTIGFGVSGGVTVHVVDPAVTSEVHPELDPVAEGVVGQPQTFRGTVRNTGSSDHPAVTATLQLPSSFQVDDARWGIAGLPCSVAASTVTCAVGDLPAHTSTTVTVGATPTVAGPADVTLTTATSVAQDDPDPVADTDTVSFLVLPAFVDLGLTHYASPDPAIEGVNWFLGPNITNHGTVAATGTRLTATLPEGVDIRSISVGLPAPADSGGCTREGQVVTCDVGTIPRGGSVRVNVSSSVTAGTTGDVEIFVTSDQPDPTPDPHPNDITQPLTVLAPRADLSARIVSPPTAVFAGQPVTLVHQVRNDGPSLLTSAVGTLEVPEGWTITAAWWDDFGVAVPCTVAGSVSTCTTGMVTVSGNQTMYATVVPDEVATGLVLTAGASATLPDDDLSDNEVTHSLDVDPLEADVGVTAIYGATVPAGTEQTVELRVRNAGPALAPDTALTATLPASVEVTGVNTFSTGFTCEVVSQVLTCTHPLMPTGQANLRLTVRDTAVGPVSFTATVATSAPQVPDTLANSVAITRTVEVAPTRITGTVVDVNGAPVPQTVVWIYRVGETSFVASATTDSAGEYTVSNLAPGEYQVRFLPSAPTGLQHEWFDDQPSRAGATVFTAAGVGEVFVADAELAPRVLTVIEGRVVDGAGQPVVGVRVGAFLAGDTFGSTYVAFTDADGRYSLTVDENEYKLRFAPPAGSGLLAEWFDDQSTRAAATPLVATAWGQVIVADATLATA